MRNNRTLLFLFVASLLVRLAIYFSFESAVGSDAALNNFLANRLAAGDFAEGFSPAWGPLYPILIAVTSLFYNSTTVPIIIVSIIGGSLAAPATYCLIIQFYLPRVAFIAGVLVVFYPHLLSSTTQLLNENIYLPFIIFAIIVFWKALTKNIIKYFFITGLLLALAYLVRPEAFGYLFFCSALALSGIYSGEKAFSGNSFKKVALLLFGFALVASPYIFYLRSATGRWTISEKFKQHVVGTNFASEDNYNFSPEKSEENSRLIESNYVLGLGKILLRCVSGNLITIKRHFQPFFPPFLYIFVGLGLFRREWSRERFKGEIYLILFCFTTVLGYLLAIVEIRYFFVLLPILLGWVARGVAELDEWFGEMLQNFPVSKLAGPYLPVFPVVLLILINIYILPLNLFMRTTETAWQTTLFEEKRAGLWIKQNGRPNPHIMGLDYSSIYYAEGRLTIFTSKSINAISAEAITKGADYLLVQERYIGETPDLSGLLNHPQVYPPLKPVYQFNDRPGYKIVVYQVKKDDDN